MAKIGPRKRPRQPRAQVTRDAVIEAAERILRSDGPKALTTNRIAKVAGVSIGSVYQYFPNKDAVLAALIDRDSARTVGAVRMLVEATRGAPFAQLVDVVIDGFFAVYGGDRAFYAALLPHVGRLEQAGLVGRWVEQVAEILLEVAAQRRDELLIDRPDHMAFIITNGINALAHAAVLEEMPATGCRLLDPSFAAEAKAMVRRYLVGEAAA